MADKESLYCVDSEDFFCTLYCIIVVTTTTKKKKKLNKYFLLFFVSISAYKKSLHCLQRSDKKFVIMQSKQHIS